MDRTLSSLLDPSKISNDNGFSDLFVNTQNTINLANSVSALSSELFHKKKQTKKFIEAQNTLHDIQNDENINQKVDEKVKASFYDSFSKKMTDFLNSGSQD